MDLTALFSIAPDFDVDSPQVADGLQYLSLKTDPEIDRIVKLLIANGASVTFSANHISAALSSGKQSHFIFGMRGNRFAIACVFPDMTTSTTVVKDLERAAQFEAKAFFYTVATRLRPV